MTKKKAIKMLMAVSGCGNRSDANYLFELMRKQLKKHPKGNPSNAEVTRRVLGFVVWGAKEGVMDSVYGVRAAIHGLCMDRKYGENIKTHALIGVREDD